MATIVRFLGGARDGLSLSTASNHPAEAQTAGVCATFSDGGRIGKRFLAASEATLRTLQTAGPAAARAQDFRLDHEYEVVDCQRHAGDTTITVRYLGRR